MTLSTPPRTMSVAKDRIPPETFSKRLVKHGLQMKGVSIAGAEALASIEHTPVKLSKERCTHGQLKGPAGAKNLLGALIVNGLCVFHRDASEYRITDQGRIYLAALRNKGLLP